MRRLGLAFAIAIAIAIAIAVAACGDDAANPDAGPQPDAHVAEGTATVSWTIADGTGAVTCSDVRASLVSLELRPTSGAPGFADAWNCDSGMGTTLERPAGPYTARVLLKNGAGQTMASADLTGTFTIPDGGDVNLGSANLVTTRTGGFTFKIDVPGAGGGNCQPESAMPNPGAGITSMRLELRTGQGTCTPVTLAAADGSMRTLGCPGMAGACVENDVEYTATGITAGDWQLGIVGLEGAETCYATTATFDVSGGDQVKNLGTILLPIDPDNMACAIP